MSPSSQETTEFDSLPYSACKSLPPLLLEIGDQIRDAIRSVKFRRMTLVEKSEVSVTLFLLDLFLETRTQ